jgi:glycosyltransferase involved in cell wall biosynthesis
MSAPEHDSRGLPRTLPGATIMQVVGALADSDKAARAAVNVALALVRSGARAIVAGRDGPLVAEMQSFGGEWIAFATATANPLRKRSNTRLLADLVGAERIDLIHARGLDAAVGASAVTSRTGAWLVASHEGTIAPGRWPDRAHARALKRCDRVIARSAYFAGLIVERYRVPRERMVVISRFIDTARFSPTAVNRERIAAVRRDWKIRGGDRIFLVPGRLEPANGQLIVVEAARLLTTGGLRRVVFVFAGDDTADHDYAHALWQRAVAQGVSALVRRVGICTDMPAAYAAADLVVLPRIAPPTFSRAAAEAAAMAKPIVACAVGALPEAVLCPPRVEESERSGWLAGPDDPIELARALAAAEAIDPETYRAMAGRARRHAERMFSPARNAATTLALYALLLEGSP